MSAFCAIYRRELAAYFATPLAFIFLIVFLLATGIFTFYMGEWFEARQADLNIFFSYHPWLYLFLMPALAMRLWADERRSGSIELLLTLPMPLSAAVLGKFLAAWSFAGLALALTCPMWISVNYLGHPDNGAILTGYLASLLMAGGYLAIGACLSAATRNHVVAFILGLAVCFLFTVSGLPLVIDFFSGWAPPPFVETIASFSVLAHFDGMSRGVVDLRDIIFFISLIGVFLAACAITIDMKRAS